MKKFFFVFVLLLLFIGGGLGGFIFLSSPPDVKDVTKHSFIIKKGQSGISVANQLEKEKYVRSNLIIRLLLKQRDGNISILPGTYELSKSMTPTQILDALTQGPKDAWVTLLEGWRREEMADELENELGIQHFNKQEFLDLTKGKEGMLFPDTYLFPKEVTAKGVVTALEQNFNRRYQKLTDQYGQGKLSQNETLTLASIVAHEASNPEDMQMVAGVLMNRIDLGMPLQSDVTLQYIKGYSSQLKTWWQEPKSEDKFLDSPFNTYQNKGLPPSPICNPGADALSAALKPTENDYIFYLADRKGVVHFAKTLAEHDALIDKYLR
jgi:UPF0755 protein